MTIPQLEKMATEVRSDCKAIINHNKDEARHLFKLWRKLNAEIQLRKNLLLFPPHIFN